MTNLLPLADLRKQDDVWKTQSGGGIVGDVSSLRAAMKRCIMAAIF